MKIVNGWASNDTKYENYTSIIKNCFDNSTGIPANFSTCGKSNSYPQQTPSHMLTLYFARTTFYF